MQDNRSSLYESAARGLGIVISILLIPIWLISWFFVGAAIGNYEGGDPAATGVGALIGLIYGVFVLLWVLIVDPSKDEENKETKID